MLDKKLDSSFDINELYQIWMDIVKYSCYPSNEDIGDKFFTLLNEYYTNPNRTFSNWNLIHNCINQLNDMPHGKLSISTKDLLMLAIFFGFIHFDASSCGGFEKSANESVEMLDRLGLNRDEIRIIFSHIASLDYLFVYQEEKAFSYHCLRDSCFFWLSLNPVDYHDAVVLLKKEANVSDSEWIECRRDFITYALESNKLMHTEEMTSTGIHSAIQNNLLDELNNLNTSYKLNTSI